MNQSDEPSTTRPSDAASDEQLITQLRHAVTASVVPETIETTVGRKALINTTTGFPLAGLRRVNMVTDPQHPDETLSLTTARAVVYWALHVPGDDPHVVGVQVRVDGTSSVFFGIVPPP